MLTTPRATLVGFAMVAIAIFMQPVMQGAIIAPAQASLDYGDFRMIATGFNKVADAISKIKACRG